MDTTCARNSTLRIPMPFAKRSESPIASFAQKIRGIHAVLNANVARKPTYVPGMSDRAIARLANGQHYEDAMRWNALAHQYGGTRIR